mgnify:CR=1 FL=1
MIKLLINGVEHALEVADEMPLLWAIRDHVRLTGTKFGCGVAQCGACTLLLDGQPARACITPVAAAVGRSLITIEGIAALPEGRAVQAAWQALEVVQCGYCQAGQIVSATALLRANPAPDDRAIDNAMGGNLCRCNTYHRIRAAIHLAARTLAQEELDHA